MLAELTVLVSLLLGGCAAPAGPKGDAPGALAAPGSRASPASAPLAAPKTGPTAPIPVPTSPEEAETPCVRACLEQSQMEARAWEAIVADCRRHCAEP